MKVANASSNSKGTGTPSIAGVNKCFVCAKTVYKMEEIVAAGHCWHIGCFTCGGSNNDGCKCRLKRDGYTEHNSQPYCHACSAKLLKLEKLTPPAPELLPASAYSSFMTSSVSPGGIQLVDAAKKGEVAAVANLLSRSADAWDVDKNYQDQGGGTALMWAAYNGHLEILNMLISAGCDAQKQNSQGCTALLCASMTGHVDIVNALLQAGVDVNVQSIQRETALMYAARAGHYEVVKVLLTAGADVQICNKNGDKAINLAKSNEIRDTLYIWADSGRLVVHSLPLVPPVPAAATYTPTDSKTSDTSTVNSSTDSNSSTTTAGADEDAVRYAALTTNVCQFLAQAAGVPARREWMQRRDALHAQYDAAKAADQFALCAKLGKSKLAVEAESAALVLSVEDYRTLVDRREQWVTALISACKELAAAETDFDALERLSQLLDSLQALTEADLAFYTSGTRTSSAKNMSGVKTVVIDDQR